MLMWGWWWAVEVLYNWIQDGGPRHSVGKQRRATPPVAAAGDKKTLFSTVSRDFCGRGAVFGILEGVLYLGCERMDKELGGLGSTPAVPPTQMISCSKSHLQQNRSSSASPSVFLFASFLMIRNEVTTRIEETRSEVTR